MEKEFKPSNTLVVFLKDDLMLVFQMEIRSGNNLVMQRVHYTSVWTRFNLTAG